MWTDFFGQIELINLAHRTDRLLQSMDELRKYGIRPLVCRATKCENGQEGIYKTLRSIFETYVHSGRPIMVFEDDCQMVVSPTEFRHVIEMAIMELPPDWDMLYLGANLPDPRQVYRYSTHLLRTARALALHAVAYSHKCMKYILSLPPELPIDLQLANTVHPLGKTFVTYPLLCTQRPSFSDIEGKATDYGCFIEDRYKKVEEYLGLPKKIVS